MKTNAILVSSSDIQPFNPVIEITETLPSHIHNLKLRQEDEAECISFGVSSSEALLACYREGVFRKTYFVDGELAAISGCGGNLLGGEASPYLLTSDSVRKISPLRFAKIYQSEVYNFLSMFPILSNWVDSRYTSAIRLLEIIGFTLGESEKFGNGMFRQFRIERA